MSADTPATITFFWRPYCGFCGRLERQLEALGLPLERRNIWEDDEARAFVRSVARGNETVPTVRVGGISLVNPRPAQVVAAIESEAPHLLPR